MIATIVGLYTTLTLTLRFVSKKSDLSQAVFPQVPVPRRLSNVFVLPNEGAAAASQHGYKQPATNHHQHQLIGKCNSSLCTHNPGMCQHYVLFQRKLQKWKSYQTAARLRWMKVLQGYNKTLSPQRNASSDTTRRTGSTQPCPVKVFWKSDSRIDEVLGGSTVRTLMDSATTHCSVSCVAARNESDADISVAMFDKDLTQWTNSTQRRHLSPRVIARLHLEGRNYATGSTVYDVPDGVEQLEEQNTCNKSSTKSECWYKNIQTDMLVSLSPYSDVPINYFFFMTDVMKCHVYLDNIPKCISNYVRKRMPLVKKLASFKYGRKYSLRSAEHLALDIAAEKGEGAPDRSTEGILASVFVSTCGRSPGDRARRALLQELMMKLPVHSYGKCMHTPGLSERRELLAEGWALLRGSSAKVRIAGLYPFHISFENSIEDHYRTEKVFLSLLTGSVPILLADPAVKDVLPPNSFINAHDFPDMSSLAEYVKQVAADEHAFAQFFKWRENVLAIEKLFLRLYTGSLHALGPYSFFCRMCKVYHSQFDPLSFRCHL